MRMVKYYEGKAGSLWVDLDRLWELSADWPIQAPEWMGREEYIRILREDGVDVI